MLGHDFTWITEEENRNAYGVLEQTIPHTVKSKAWRNWPTLLAKHHCSRPNSSVRWLSIAFDAETNNSVWQAKLASFARP